MYIGMRRSEKTMDFTFHLISTGSLPCVSWQSYLSQELPESPRFLPPSRRRSTPSFLWLLGVRFQVLTLHGKHFDHWAISSVCFVPFDHCVPVLSPRPWKLHVNVLLASEALVGSSGSYIYPEACFSVEDGGSWPWLGQLHWHADLWFTWCYKVSFPYHLSWMPCPARILSDVIPIVSLTAGHSDCTSGINLFSISGLLTGPSPTKPPLCPAVTMGSGIHPLYKLMPAYTKTLRDSDKSKMIWLLGLTARCQIGLQLLAFLIISFYKSFNVVVTYVYILVPIHPPTFWKLYHSKTWFCLITSERDWLSSGGYKSFLSCEQSSCLTKLCLAHSSILLSVRTGWDLERFALNLKARKTRELDHSWTLSHEFWER